MNYLPQTFEGKFLFSNWTIKDRIQSYIFCKQSKKKEDNNKKITLPQLKNQFY